MDGLSAAHEALCRRCGQSCHFAIPINGLPVVIDDLHCRFLVRKGDRFHCTVYEERFERAPWCATVNEALADGLLAQDCPYAAHTRGYRGKTRLHSRMMALALPAIRHHVITEGVPAGVSHDGIRRFLERTGGGNFRIVEGPARITIEEVDMSERSVLLVDDDRDLLLAGRLMLEHLGYGVLEASDGSLAIEMFGTHHESLVAVLLDLRMPVLGGPEALEALQAIDPRVPIILSSGLSPAEARQKYGVDGFAGYLCKPWSVNDLQDALTSLDRAAT